MIHLVDIMLVASGTATLQVGLLKKPMVIMYKMKWLTGVFAKLFVRGTKFFGLANLIVGRMMVPEVWQADANVDNISNLLDRYLTDEAYRAKVINELGELRSYLGDKGATQRVVAALDEYLKA
jgi:lipid-A-disaccharide synthase